MENLAFSIRFSIIRPWTTSGFTCKVSRTLNLTNELWEIGEKSSPLTFGTVENSQKFSIGPRKNGNERFENHALNNFTTHDCIIAEDWLALFGDSFSFFKGVPVDFRGASFNLYGFLFDLLLMIWFRYRERFRARFWGNRNTIGRFTVRTVLRQAKMMTFWRQSFWQKVSAKGKKQSFWQKVLAKWQRQSF